MTLEFQISIVECLKDCNLEHESCTVGNVQFDSVVVNYNYKMFARLGSGLPLGSTNLLFIIKLFAYSFLTFDLWLCSISLAFFDTNILSVFGYQTLGISDDHSVPNSVTNNLFFLNNQRCYYTLFNPSLFEQKKQEAANVYPISLAQEPPTSPLSKEYKSL